MRADLFATLPAICFTILAACVPPKTEIKTAAPPGVPDLGKDPEKIVEDSLDAASMGGQPGKITLNGIISKLAKLSQGGDSALQVESMTGTGWRGTRAKLNDAQAAVFTDELTDDQKKAIQNKFETRALAFGCSEEVVKKHIGSFDPATVKFDPKTFSESVKIVSAETILLCGESPLPASLIVSVTAKILILQDVSFAVNAAGGLIARAAKLSVHGKNAISSFAEDGQTTLVSGSAISIAVQDDLVLEGSLKISAKGSSFKKAK